ncbi:hypothetical protein CT19431_MP30380 [Cupriavidus taiwanensis]|nr:hypothetical protein CT19431_MP30380 [Cupriavidus taiwanensis]
MILADITFLGFTLTYYRRVHLSPMEQP